MTAEEAYRLAMQDANDEPLENLEAAERILQQEQPMIISLKSVKISEHLSEETTAFSATLYVDGKRAATIKNHGTGGCNFYSTPVGNHALLDSAIAAAREACGWEHEPLDGFVEELLARADPHMVRWASRAAKDGCTHLYDKGEGRWAATRGPDGPDSLPIDHFRTSPSLTLDRATAEACDLILDAHD